MHYFLHHLFILSTKSNFKPTRRTADLLLSYVVLDFQVFLLQLDESAHWSEIYRATSPKPIGRF